MNNNEKLVLGVNETVEQVFETFNGAITAIESENNCKLVSDYDEFINDSDFNLRIYAIHKLENENFWRVINNKNDYKVVNMGKTYGKSTVYQISKGKQTIGFYLNNMLHDGQTTYFLWSLKEKTFKNEVFSTKDIVEKLFLTNRAYPKVKQFTNGKLNRWGKIIAKLEANGASTVNAYEFLEKNENIMFYGELKKHNVLSEQDKQLLKAIRKTNKPMSFDCLIESTEDRKTELEAKIAEYYDSEEAPFPISDLVHYEWELEEVTSNLSNWTEEDNSLKVDSELEDYNW